MARLLLIAPTCDGTDVGEAWVAYQWARWLRERHDVTLLTYHKRGAIPARDQLDGLTVIEWTEPAGLGRFERLNSIAKPGYLAFYWKARRWIERAVRDGASYDVAFQPTPVAMRYPSPATGLPIPLIVGPVGGGLSDPPCFAATARHEPWYYRLRDIDGFRMRHDRMLRRTYEEAACVLGIADYVREGLAAVRVARFEVLAETGIELVAEPVDRSGRGAVRALFAGRLVRSKGIHELLDACAALRCEVSLDVAGDGPEMASCLAQVDALGIGRRVTFHGWLSKPDVGALYRAADMFVFPSYREPGGNVAFEAMSFGLPLVVADRGGPASFTTDDCAIRIPVGDPQAFRMDIAAAIDRLAADAGLRRRMGDAARAHVINSGTWRAKVDRLDELITEATADRR